MYHVCAWRHVLANFFPDPLRFLNQTLLYMSQVVLATSDLSHFVCCAALHSFSIIPMAYCQISARPMYVCQVHSLSHSQH